jgi:hypothetical protein
MKSKHTNKNKSWSNHAEGKKNAQKIKSNIYINLKNIRHLWTNICCKGLNMRLECIYMYIYIIFIIMITFEKGRGMKLDEDPILYETRLF